MNTKLSQSNRLGRLILFSAQYFALGLLLLAVALYNWSTRSNSLYIPIKEVAIKTILNGYLQGTDDDIITEEDDILYFENMVDLESIEPSTIETQLTLQKA